jgi:hypothetical protein
MAVTNTLAYYDTATITAVKSFIVIAPVEWKDIEGQGPEPLGACAIKLFPD